MKEHIANDEFIFDEKCKNRKKLKRLILVMLIIAVILITAFINKTKLINLAIYNDLPGIHTVFKSIGGTTYSDEELTLKYVPLGYEMELKNSTPANGTLAFLSSQANTTEKAGDKMYFQLTVHSFDLSYNIDTEDGYVENIKIKGFDGAYISNKNINGIVWGNDICGIFIVGNISKEELFKIANNLIVTREFE